MVFAILEPLPEENKYAGQARSNIGNPVLIRARNEVIERNRIRKIYNENRFVSPYSSSNYFPTTDGPNSNYNTIREYKDELEERMKDPAYYDIIEEQNGVLFTKTLRYKRDSLVEHYLATALVREPDEGAWMLDYCYETQLEVAQRMLESMSTPDNNRNYKYVIIITPSKKFNEDYIFGRTNVTADPNVKTFSFKAMGVGIADRKYKAGRGSNLNFGPRKEIIPDYVIDKVVKDYDADEQDSTSNTRFLLGTLKILRYPVAHANAGAGARGRRGGRGGRGGGGRGGGGRGGGGGAVVVAQDDQPDNDDGDVIMDDPRDDEDAPAVNLSSRGRPRKPSSRYDNATYLALGRAPPRRRSPAPPRNRNPAAVAQPPPINNLPAYLMPPPIPAVQRVSTRGRQIFSSSRDYGGGGGARRRFKRGGRVIFAGCAQDARHATLRMASGKVIRNIRSPKHMCVIATLRHAMKLTKPSVMLEKYACRDDHLKIFRGLGVSLSEKLRIDDSILERLGDYYDTDIAIIGETSYLSTKARDNVTTMYYEHGHVWLVVADDRGHCRCCNKQYTSVQWLTEHRRTCHRCPQCYTFHSNEKTCGYCSICRINHPISDACNESRSAHLRDISMSSEKRQEVVMEFKRSWLDSPDSFKVLHYDIETAQFPNQLAQFAFNIEWAVRCSSSDVSDGDIVFFEDHNELFRVDGDIAISLYCEHVEEHEIGGRMWRMHSAFGECAMDEFIDFLCASDRDYILNAYNGSRFDHLFLLKGWQQRDLDISSIAFQGTCPIMGKLKGPKSTHSFWDISRHLNGSLSDAAHGAGLCLAKDSFHDFHLLTSMNAIMERQSIIQKYCRIDTQLLALLTESTMDSIYSKFGVHITDFLTTSHMTYTLAFLGSPVECCKLRIEKLAEKKNSSKLKILREKYVNYINSHADIANKWNPIYDVFIERDVEREESHRYAIYGGRSIPMQMLYISPDYDDVMAGRKKYSDVEYFIHDLDVNSLYPFSMSKNMPIGEPTTWDRSTPVPRENMGIYFIRYRPNKSLYTAILPSHKHDGGLVWSLEDGEGWYTSVDINNALKYGYEVDYVAGHYWTKCGPVFKDYIDYLYKSKDVEKQKKYIPNGGYSASLYSQFKLLLNGLWGKTSQRPITRVTQNLRDVDKIVDFFNAHSELSFTSIGKHDGDVNFWVQGEVEDTTSKITKPSHIACFVLAYSRQKMLEYMDHIDPGLTSASYTYTDTDSIFTKVTPENRQSIESLFGSDIGLINSDLCDPQTGGKNGRVIKMIVVAPKTYFCEYILDNNTISSTVHAKGIHTSFFRTHKDKIACGLEEMLYDRGSGVKRKRMVFSWGDSLQRGGEMVDDYESKAPFMVKCGFKSGFDVKHAYMSRMIGRTEYEGRCFSSPSEMSTPIGFQV
jgi:hypothetical protein